MKPNAGRTSALLFIGGFGLMFLGEAFTLFVPPDSSLILASAVLVVTGAVALLCALVILTRTVFARTPQTVATEFAGRAEPLLIRRVPGTYRIAGHHCLFLFWTRPPELVVDAAWAESFPWWLRAEFFKFNVELGILRHPETKRRFLLRGAWYLLWGFGIGLLWFLLKSPDGGGQPLPEVRPA